MDGKFHTPGPWQYATQWNVHTGKIRVSDSFDEAVTDVWGGDAEALANARLIATAPDLVEAARDALAGWRYIRKYHGDLYGVAWDRVEQALSLAIARAEGK